MKIAFVEKSFRAPTLETIETARDICEEYAAEGFDLTLRQLYYQFVARGFIANRQSEYKRLGNIVNDARLAGLLDWDHIVDRTRNLRSLRHWYSPEQIARNAAASYHKDLWTLQPYRPEVWIEKDALVGVISRVCDRNDVPYFSCRGYVSQSEVFQAGYVRMRGYLTQSQQPVVIHLGDHDPSGLDMTRDISDRLAMFVGSEGDVDSVEVRRIALNKDQIEEIDPPPNPAKLSDARAKRYVQEHGYESWELDALDPRYLERIIDEEISALRDDAIWALAVAKMEDERDRLRHLADSL